MGLPTVAAVLFWAAGPLAGASAAAPVGVALAAENAALRAELAAVRLDLAEAAAVRQALLGRCDLAGAPLVAGAGRALLAGDEDGYGGGGARGGGGEEAEDAAYEPAAEDGDEEQDLAVAAGARDRGGSDRNRARGSGGGDTNWDGGAGASGTRSGRLRGRGRGGDGGGGEEEQDIVPGQKHGSLRHSDRGIKADEHGQWVKLSNSENSYVFVSKTTGKDGSYQSTNADDNLRAALGLNRKSNDNDILSAALDTGRWARSNDYAYRDKVCRGTKHEMPRWCRSPAGPGGKLAENLDTAEVRWQESAAKRQQSKLNVLAAHRAFLREAAIQREAMEYTKKALEAQEAVDAAARLAAERDRQESSALEELENQEAKAWRQLVNLRHQVVKYRTLSREQVDEMEHEAALERKRVKEEEAHRERQERLRLNHEAAQQARLVEKLKERVKRTDREFTASQEAAQALRRERAQAAREAKTSRLDGGWDERRPESLAATGKRLGGSSTIVGRAQRQRSGTARPSRDEEDLDAAGALPEDEDDVGEEVEA